MEKIFSLSSPCARAVSNQKLHQELEKSHTVILTSAELQIPIAAYQHYIVVPQDLQEKFSQDEFDAVIAHELEHLRWKDPILKLFFNTISTLFWWIPTIWWLKRLEADQEEASDSGLRKYGIDPVFLATALMKLVNQTKYANLKYDFAPTCGLNSSKSLHMQRFENLLNPSQTSKSHFYRFLEVLGSGLCVLVCICFWMC